MILRMGILSGNKLPATCPIAETLAAVDFVGSAGGALWDKRKIVED